MPALRVGSQTTGPPFRGQLDDLRVYSRLLAPAEIEQLALHYRARAVLSGVTGGARERAAYVREYFLTYGASEALRTANAELKALRLERTDLQKTIPSAMVMADMKKPRDTFVLARGDYRNQTEKVQPGVPSMLPPLPEGAPLNRLTLAKWLVDPKHPLTARVAVNRFWQTYFGTGIVKTQEDFGVQGEPPVHPELLDWLATEFITSGWDIRAMQRLVVTSATIPAIIGGGDGGAARSRSRESAAGARPRGRLAARVVRDTALAASGLLNAEIGGPSVSPISPRGCGRRWRSGRGSRHSRTSRGRARRDLYRPRDVPRSGSAPCRPRRSPRSTHRIGKSAPPAAR